MCNRGINKQSARCLWGHFGTLTRRIATHTWTILAALLAILPCPAQPPGIIYSTTLPYSGTPDDCGYTPVPYVSLVATDPSGNSYIAGFAASKGLPTTPGVVQPGYA